MGKALYSAGQFEKALAEFHKAYRMRPNNMFEEWIGRCEETIKAFLTATKIDCEIVEKLLADEESKNWIDILTANPCAMKPDNEIINKKSTENLDIKKAKD